MHPGSMMTSKHEAEFEFLIHVNNFSVANTVIAKLQRVFGYDFDTLERKEGVDIEIATGIPENRYYEVLGYTKSIVDLLQN